MATIAMLPGGHLVNALAFSGSNFLFSKLRSSSVDVERKRHDMAVEKLAVAQKVWSQRRSECLDWQNEELRRQNHAVQTFRSVDAVIREYGRVYNTNRAAALLSEYYTPSNGQNDREIAFIITGMALTGLVAYKLS